VIIYKLLIIKWIPLVNIVTPPLVILDGGSLDRGSCRLRPVAFNRGRETEWPGLGLAGPKDGRSPGTWVSSFIRDSTS
jgi:hypothetical protein